VEGIVLMELEQEGAKSGGGPTCSSCRIFFLRRKIVKAAAVSATLGTWRMICSCFCCDPSSARLTTGLGRSVVGRWAWPGWLGRALCKVIMHIIMDMWLTLF